TELQSPSCRGTGNAGTSDGSFYVFGPLSGRAEADRSGRRREGPPFFRPSEGRSRGDVAYVDGTCAGGACRRTGRGAPGLAGCTRVGGRGRGRGRGERRHACCGGRGSPTGRRRRARSRPSPVLRPRGARPAPRRTTGDHGRGRVRRRRVRRAA